VKKGRWGLACRDPARGRRRTTDRHRCRGHAGVLRPLCAACGGKPTWRVTRPTCSMCRRIENYRS